MNTRLFTFIGSDSGLWRVVSTATVVGAPFPEATRVDVISGLTSQSELTDRWMLRGITSNERYVVREEKIDLVAKQQGLGRPEASRAALIPIRKNQSWWALTQDERRAVIEERSQHIKIGLRYLPAIARRLHHCRDLSESEPFDFITWFEYAPAHENEFNDLLAELRTSEEWSYINREIDIRLMRD